jgi:hypothetical protein
MGQCNLCSCTGRVSSKQLKFLPPGKDKDPNMHMNMRIMLVPRLPPVIKTYEILRNKTRHFTLVLIFTDTLFTHKNA